MKHILLIAFAICSIHLFAQPQAINYQGVARNSQGLPLVNHNISLRLSILDSSMTGQPVYVETQNVTTSSSGLFNIGIGLGSVVSGIFFSIRWGQGDKWLKTELDTVGGGNFQLIGTTQFLSVPFALTAGNISGTYSIGLNIDLGGYVFYVTPDGKHGLVSEIQDQNQTQNGNNINWYMAQDSISYPINHSAIGQKHIDWRLPTFNELILMYNAKLSIGGFSNDFYWSSREWNYAQAWIKNFLSGYETIDLKTNDHIVRVRAVRDF